MCSLRGRLQPLNEAEAYAPVRDLAVIGFGGLFGGIFVSKSLAFILQLPGRKTPQVVEFLFEQGRPQLELMAFVEDVQQTALETLPGHALVFLLDAVLDRVLQLVERFHAERFRKFIVDGGKLDLFDLMHGHRERRLLAREFRLGIVLREGCAHFFGLARAHAGDAGGEPGNEALLRELHRLPVGLTALERLIVDSPLIVDYEVIPHLGRAGHGNKRSAIARQCQHAAFDIGFAHVDRFRVEHDPIVSAQLDWRAHRNVRFDAHRTLVLRRKHFHLGPVDRCEIVLAHRPRICFGHNVFDRTIVDDLAAILLLEDLARNLTRPKAWNLRRAREPTECPFFGGADLFGRNGNLQLHFGGRNSGQGGLRQAKSPLLQVGGALRRSSGQAAL